MSSARLVLVCFLLLGLASALSFHSSGALSERDALTIAAFDGGVATSPPGPVTVRALRFGADVIRLVRADTGIFRAVHLAAGLLLALAAALSACLAHRAAGSDVRGWIAASVVAAGILFGADSGRLGLEAGPVSVTLALLSGAALAWTARRPRAALGGFLLGLALADQPLVLFLLPGAGALALGGTLRIPATRGAAYVSRAWVGFLIGAAALLLPLFDVRRSGLLMVSRPSGFGEAIAAWWGAGDAAAWTIAGPSAWFDGAASWGIALWHGAGPLGMVLGLAGLLAFFRGGARLARPFLLLHGVLALAVVLGRTAEPGLAASLLAWSFLFWTVPTLAAFATPRAAVAGVVSAALLFAMNARGLDRAAEKGTAWASTVLETAPPDAVLITGNPVHFALAADGLRPDVDLVDPDHASSLTSYRSGRPLLRAVPPAGDGPIPPPVLRDVIRESLAARPVLLAPGLYFRDDSYGGARDVQFTFTPHGIAYRVLFAGESPGAQDVVDAIRAWEDVNVLPGTPASPLRDGLTGGQYFARAIQVSGNLLIAERRDYDAERDFFLALTHPDANPTAAAQGLAQFFYVKHDYAEAVEVLRTWVRDDDPGAWVALRLLANSYRRIRRPDEAREALKRALEVTPPYLADERAEILNQLENLERIGSGSR